VHRIVPALERARSQRGRKAKVLAIAEALKTVAESGEDEDLATAARFVGGNLLGGEGNATIGVGYALVMQALCDTYKLSPAELQSRARAAGDLGDGLGELLLRAPQEPRVGLRIAELRDLAKALAATTDRTTKASLLKEAYSLARPDQAVFLTKALLGELRIGVRDGILEEAIGAAFGEDPKAVAEAATLCPDQGELAKLAHHHELSCATFTVGTRIAFMLASPIETVKAPLDPAKTVWEDKLDGIRVQVHVQAGTKTTLFARGGGDVTAAFPEIAGAFQPIDEDIVLDGELLAVAPDLSPRPFQALQARLNRKDPSAELVATTPVALFAFDMLYARESLLARPLAERRASLEAFFRSAALAPHAQATTERAFDPARPLEEQIDAAYAEARGRGHEGIVVKDSAAPYEAGKRGSAWRKVKRAVATLDVVITGAEQGHGKRAHVLSDYTFAVWDREREPHALVDIGKAYSGLTDAEIATMTTQLRELTTGTKGGVLLIPPRYVLEVAFDGIQPSSRHTSGLALRFPRIVRIRDDKLPEDADTLATARALWNAQVASGHREESSEKPAAARAPARGRPKREKPSSAPAQLSLFGDGKPGSQK
jgi:DNA ligase-1